MADRRQKGKAPGSVAEQAQARPGRNPPGKRKRAGAGTNNGGSARAAPHFDVGYGKPPRHTQFAKGQPRPPRKPRPEVEPSFEDYFEE